MLSHAENLKDLKSVIDLAKTETSFFSGQQFFLQSIKETETLFVKMGLTGETISGPCFAGWTGFLLFTCARFDVNETKLR